MASILKKPVKVISELFTIEISIELNSNLLNQWSY